MKTTTHIPGKDAPLEETIDFATNKLNSLGIEVSPTSWLNPAPNCWSVHLQATTCPALYTNGKGTSQLASLASGLGEFFERLSTDYFFAEYCLENKRSNTKETRPNSFRFFPDEIWFSSSSSQLPSHNDDGLELLSPGLRGFYNPSGELQAQHLLENNLDHENLSICALPFIDLSTKNRCLFPLAILNNLYVSNGMAAGNSPAECNSQALSEILERYVKNIVISRGITLPDVPAQRLASFSALKGIITALEKEGLQIQVKDSSLGGRYPVICVLLLDKDSSGIFAAFGCNCRFETAVERTLTELLQGRNLDQLRGFQAPVHDIDLVAEPYNLESHFIDSDGLLAWSMLKNNADYPYKEWDFKGTTSQELHLLKEIIRKEGCTVYRAEYNHCGMYTCRIVVPSMSEIYPVDDLVWSNRNRGATLRPTLLKLPQLSDTELRHLLALLDDLGVNDHQLVSEVIGILFDSDSTWSTLTLGELRALVYLALQDHHKSYEWCTWCIDFAEMSPKRKIFYQLLHTLLGFKTSGATIDEYTRVLSHLFSREDRVQALDILEGKERFFDLSFGACWSEISRNHSQLLNTYNLLHDIKKGAVANATTP